MLRVWHASLRRPVDGLKTHQPHQAAHGFRRGRSIRSHARTHLRQRILIQCDLESWFHQFTYAQVRDLFQRLGYGRPVARLLALLCTAPVREMTPALVAATGLSEAEVIALVQAGDATLLSEFNDLSGTCPTEF